MERDEPSISPELAAGEILGTYAIEALLGRTDGCLEYRAREQTDGRIVRIREYYPAQIAIRAGKTAVPAKDANASEFDYGLHRFVQSGQASMRLKHDNLLRYLQILELNGTAYHVVEMPLGLPLEDWLSEIGGIADQDTVDTIARQLCDVLGTLHKAEQLHLNVCPGTIYIEPQSSKLTLLESFTAIRGFSPREASYWHGYLPPESVSDQRRRLETAAADIYSAGAILLRATTGQPPPTITNRTAADTVQASLSALEGRYRPSFLRAVGQALAMPVTERPGSILEWRGALVPPTARRSHGTRFKALDNLGAQPSNSAPTALRTSQGSLSLAIGSALLFTLCGLAIGSELRNPTRIQNTAYSIVAMRPVPPSDGDRGPKSPPVAARKPKGDPVTPVAPQPKADPSPLPPAPAKPKEATPIPPPPIASRPSPEAPVKPKAVPDPRPAPTPPVVEPKPGPEQPKIVLPSPPLPEPKIALPQPIPLPSFLRRTRIGSEDTVVSVPSRGKPTGEGAFYAPWLALANQGGTPTIQIFKIENGGLAGTPPSVTYTPPAQVARMALEPRASGEMLVAASEGTLFALDRDDGRWHKLSPEPTVTKRILCMAFDPVQKSFAVVSVLRQASGSASAYTTIVEWFSASKKKGATRTLIAEGNLVQAAAIWSKQFALAVRGKGLVVLDSGADRRLLDHQLRETLNVIEYSSAGKYLAAGGEAAHVYLWEQSNDRFGEPKKISVPVDDEHSGRDAPFIRSIAFSADENLVAAGLSSGTILVWSIRAPTTPLMKYVPSSPGDVLAWLHFVDSGEGKHFLLFPSVDGAVRSFAVESKLVP